jgi:hypothetical protein
MGLATLIAVALAGCQAPPDTSAAAGWWLWSVETEDGSVIRTITDADMDPSVGSAGWPGCPDGILCTR